MSPKHQLRSQGLTMWELLLVLAITMLLIFAIASFTKGTVFTTINEKVSDILGSESVPTDNPPTPSKPSRPSKPPLHSDRALSTLRWGNLAFEAPIEVEIGATAHVELAVTGQGTIEELKALLGNPVNSDGSRVQISDHMEAKLFGSGFEISPVTPERQLVGSQQVTRWKWLIKANSLGAKQLNLSLNALLKLNNSEVTKTVNTFSRNISVSVWSTQGVWGFLEAYKLYLGAFFTAVLVPVVRWLFQRRSKSDA